MQIPHILRRPNKHSMRLPTIFMLMSKSRIHLIQSLFQKYRNKQSLRKISMKTNKISHSE